MKLHTSHSKLKEAGGSLLATTFICFVLATTVISYLMLLSQQTKLSTSSQSWNLAISLAEAGVEEGLQQLNSNYAALTTDGWTYDGTAYWIQRTFSNGNSYTVYLTNSSNPTIYARANVAASVFTRSGSPFMLAAAGLTTVSPASRAVVVTCQKGSLFTKAMVAKHTINMNGNNITTDSFDSGNPTYSTGGQYDSTKTESNGDVASNDSIINSVNVGNANIHGHVATGPGGSVSVGANGVVGSYAWANAGNNGIQSGWSSSDSNFTFPDTSLPYNSGLAPTSGNIVTSSSSVSSISTNSSSYPSPVPASGVTTNTTSTSSQTYPSAGTYSGSVTTNVVTTGPAAGRGTWYAYNNIGYNYTLTSTNVTYTTNYYANIINTGDYYATSLSGSTLVTGSARLVLPNGLSGGENFTIASTGSLQVYAGGTSCAINGNNVINQPGLAEKFILYCAPTVTSFSLSGNAGFTGVLVAPNVNISLNGGGNNTIDFIGAMIVNSVTMNGHFNFHYDEALGRLAANGRYLVTSWKEVTP